MLNIIVILIFSAILLNNCENFLNTDDVPPQIVITSPAEGETITKPIEINVIVNDNNKIKKVSYFIDNEMVGYSKSKPYKYILDLSLWANDSTHSLMAVAEDQSGNKGYSEIINIFIPSYIYPSVNIVFPEDNSYYNENEDIILKWRNIPQLSKYIIEISIDNDFQSISNTFETEDTNSVFTLDKGKYHLRVKGVNSVSKQTGWSNILTLYVGTVIFTKFYRSAENEIGYCVREDINGEYIITGAITGLNTYSVHYSKLLLSKLSKTGELIWLKSYDDYRVGKSLLIDNEYYLVTGRSESGKICLVKFDHNGEVIWNKIYNLSGEGKSIIIGSDNSYYITGYTNSYGAGHDDVVLLKTDFSGELKFSKYYGGSEDDCGNVILETANDMLIIGGSTDSFGAGNSDYWIINLDLNGNILWDKTYGGDNWDVGFSISSSLDNGLVIAGRSSSYDNGILVLSVDMNGNLNWKNTFGERFSEGGYSIISTDKSDYLITGYLSSQETGSDVFLLHLNSSGDDLELSQLYNRGEDVGYFIDRTSDGGIIITGFLSPSGKSNYDLLVLRTDDTFTIDQIEQ